MNHSPTPWKATDDRAIPLVDANGEPVLGVLWAGADGEWIIEVTPENLQHIVDCVEFCHGIRHAKDREIVPIPKGLEP